MTNFILGIIVGAILTALVEIAALLIITWILDHSPHGGNPEPNYKEGYDN